jgi:ABC-type branched-subunit amino acid transport system ATPase component
VTTLLSAAIASSRYGQIEALRDVEINVDDGEIVAVLGANGAGKTTLLRTISGVLVKATATITLNGQDLSKLAAPARVRAGVMHVPEGRRVFGDLTVAENLDVIDRGDRNCIQIRARIATASRTENVDERRLMPPLAVDEHEHLIRTEPAQAGRIDVVGSVGARLPIRIKGRRDHLQQLIQVELPGSLQRFIDIDDIYW